jgi:hypothetical protein
LQAYFFHKNQLKKNGEDLAWAAGPAKHGAAYGGVGEPCVRALLPHTRIQGIRKPEGKFLYTDHSPSPLPRSMGRPGRPSSPVISISLFFPFSFRFLFILFIFIVVQIEIVQIRKMFTTK